MSYVTDHANEIIGRIEPIHAEIRRAVGDRMYSSEVGFKRGQSRAVFDGSGDTVYAIDVPAEKMLDVHCNKLGEDVPFVLISEATGKKIYPSGTKEDDCKFIWTSDVIDGTRGLMYDVRPAWTLSGIAPNNGPDTSLKDIELAIQTEIPTTRQAIIYLMHAVKGKGAVIREYSLIHDKEIVSRTQNQPTPSTAPSIAHGFCVMVKFFRDGLGELAQMEEELYNEILGPVMAGRADTFNDQYISNAAQIEALMTGRYRFVADLRPLLGKIRKGAGNLGLCAHPYDLCTELIAREAGVIITDEKGEPLNAPLDTTTNVAWIGYANEDIREQVEGPLMEIIEKYTNQ